MAKTERLEFRVDPEFMEKVQKLADKDGVTRAEIVRRAIGLYEYAATLAQKGFVLTPEESAPKQSETSQRSKLVEA